jgi:serine/threonine protein phosphatase PrpC
VTVTPLSAAVSHVGKIRSNNQDSGYAGRHLFIVADGMGGHAGGDVASAIATKRLAEADTDYTIAEDAEQALRSAMIAANSLLAETVFEHSELTRSRSPTSATRASTGSATANSSRSPPTTPSCNASSTRDGSRPKRPPCTRVARC